MSRQIPEEQGHEKLGCKKVWCRDTRHSYRDKNKTTKYNLCRDIIKVCCDTIQEQA